MAPLATYVWFSALETWPRETKELNFKVDNKIKKLIQKINTNCQQPSTIGKISTIQIDS